MLRFIKYGMVFVIAASPWAFGSIKPWGYTSINLLGLLFLFLWALHRMLTKDADPIYVPKALYPLVAFMILVVAQLLPLPFSVIKSISPARAAYLDTLNLNATGFFLPNHPTLTVDPYLTTLALVNFTSLVIYFFLLAQLLQGRPVNVDPVDQRPKENPQTLFLKTLVFTIVTVGFLIALYGIIQKLSDPTRIYWFYKKGFGADPMGPFFNRDHFAGYLEMPAGMALGLLLFLRGRVPYRWLLALSIVVMGAAIFYSGSRGGVLCFLFELACAGVLVYVFRPAHSQAQVSLSGRRPAAALLTIPLLLTGVILAVSYIGPDPILGSLNEKVSKDNRLVMWKVTRNIAEAYPLCGSGFGALRAIYPNFEYQDDQEITAQAHGDFVQLLSETGVLGGFLILGFLALLVTAIFKWASSHFHQAARFGAILGILGILLHSFFDFNLQIFSNALLFATLCALCVTRQRDAVLGVEN